MAEGAVSGSCGAKPQRPRNVLLSNSDSQILASIKDLWKRPKTWDESKEEFAYGRLIYYGNKDANGCEYGYAHAKMPDGSRRDVFLHKNSLARQEYAEVLKARLALGEEIFLSFLYIPSSKKAGQYEATYIDMVEKAKEAEVREYCTRRRIKIDSSHLGLPDRHPTPETVPVDLPIVSEDPGIVETDQFPSNRLSAGAEVMTGPSPRKNRKTLLPLPVLAHRSTTSSVLHSLSPAAPPITPANRAPSGTPHRFPVVPPVPRHHLPSRFATGCQFNGLSKNTAPLSPAPHQIGPMPSAMDGSGQVYSENGPRFQFVPHNFSIPPPPFFLPPNVAYLPLPPPFFPMPIGSAAGKWPPSAQVAKGSEAVSNECQSPSGFGEKAPRNATLQQPGVYGHEQLETSKVQPTVYPMDWSASATGNSGESGSKESKIESPPENFQSESLSPGKPFSEQANQIPLLPPLPQPRKPEPPPPPPILEPHEEEYFKGIPLSDECKKKLTKSIKSINITRPMKRKMVAKGVPDSCPLCQHVEPSKKLVLLMFHVLRTHVLKKEQEEEKLRYECAICARKFELKWPAAFCTLNCGGAFANFGKQE